MSGTKDRAEGILRELPSVVDAFVREDVYGDPREVHLLIRSGPEPRDLATDVRDLLEERLGVPVDQRIISIAQLREAASEALPLAADGYNAALALAPPQAPTHSPELLHETVPLLARPAAAPMGEAEPGRATLAGVEVRRENGRVMVAARLVHAGQEFSGEAAEPDFGLGSVRAAARAGLRAVESALLGAVVLELESASVVRALDRDVVLVAASALAPELGRRARHLAGAHPVEARPEGAAVLAALKATNRTAEMA
ncbi:MAG: hypothetical protein ABFS34_15055 [Gemmatimonadota bacterium]